jgi:sporulation protein YlmC with PRC-barrel domain
MHTEFSGHAVLDQAGGKIGAVSDLISDRTTLEPRWLVVDMGLMKSSHLVPVEGSYRTEDGDIVVPFSKDVLKHAPKTGGDHVLTPDTEDAVVAYYGLHSQN